MGRFGCFKRYIHRKLKGSKNNGSAKEKHQFSSLVSKLPVESGPDTQKNRLVVEEILRLGERKKPTRIFAFDELCDATNEFSLDCLIGEGGFGRVYRGYLQDAYQDIAVKQLERNGFQGNREFLVEVLVLSRLQHPNLVNLIGYCADGDQRILVYEYMPLGSLEDHLFDLLPSQKPLDWITRMKIAEGAAKGLEHLHDTANPPVIYRDFKASNILLDADYKPKLSDFGLAKVGPVGDKTHVSTRVMGTYGYCAPEYARTGKLTKMSDVYSFGVVFLEIITGKRAIDMTKPSNEQNLVNWAEPLLKNKRRFGEMADPLLGGRYPVKGLYQALAIAAMCLQDEASSRPLISDVVTALEYLATPAEAAPAPEYRVLSPEPEEEKSAAAKDGEGELQRALSDQDSPSLLKYRKKIMEWV